MVSAYPWSPPAPPPPLTCPSFRNLPLAPTYVTRFCLCGCCVHHTPHAVCVVYIDQVARRIALAAQNHEIITRRSTQRCKSHTTRTLKTLQNTSRVRRTERVNTKHNKQNDNQYFITAPALPFRINPILQLEANPCLRPSFRRVANASNC